MTLASDVADFVVGLEPTDIPREVSEEAKSCLLDWIGITLAGSNHANVQAARGSLSIDGRAGEATIIGRHERTSRGYAAYVNGVAGHALNFDDMSPTYIGHNTSLCAPVAFALGEALRASGSEILTAFVCGWEVACAMGRGTIPTHYQQGWHSSGTIGVFGCTAVAAKLLKLSPGESAHALGLAASCAAGLRENLGTPANVGHIGHAAEQGLRAAIQASCGWTSAATAVEGFYRVLARDHDPFQGPRTLGRSWALVQPGVSRKLYPSCGAMHPAIEGILALTRAHSLEPGDIGCIECWTTPAVAGLLSLQPPATSTAAQYCLPLGVAAAICHRQVGIETFEAPVFQDPAIRALMQLVTLKVDTSLAGSDMSSNFTTTVVIGTRSGERLAERVEATRGPMIRSLTADELRRKFEMCAGRVVPSAQAEEIARQVEHFETLGDFRQFAEILAPRAAPCP